VARAPSAREWSAARRLPSRRKITPFSPSPTAPAPPCGPGRGVPRRSSRRSVPCRPSGHPCARARRRAGSSPWPPVDCSRCHSALARLLTVPYRYGIVFVTLALGEAQQVTTNEGEGRTMATILAARGRMTKDLVTPYHVGDK